MDIMGKILEPTDPKVSQDAKDSADDYLVAAINSIDSRFGAGYAQQNPVLVGAYMQTASTEFLSYMIHLAVSKSLDGISDAVRELGGE